MKGPSDVSDLLAGLKPKPKSVNDTQIPSIPIVQEVVEDSGSTISISELKELQSEGTVPTKTKRKVRSNKNTISLDI